MLLRFIRSATLSTGAELICDTGQKLRPRFECHACRHSARYPHVWIANPNNPTGNFLPYPEVRAFLETVPPDVVVVLDEAYNEYLPPAERVDTAAGSRIFRIWW
jgi:histidinol-phosphate aminotransferase